MVKGRSPTVAKLLQRECFGTCGELNIEVPPHPPTPPLPEIAVGPANVTWRNALPESGSTEAEGTHGPAQVPPALQISIETLVDDERALLSAVLLGFTRSGDHLISYTSGEDGWHLQLWIFTPGMRCKRLYKVPLFTAQADDGAVPHTVCTALSPQVAGDVATALMH